MGIGYPSSLFLLDPTSHTILISLATRRRKVVVSRDRVTAGKEGYCQGHCVPTPSFSLLFPVVFGQETNRGLQAGDRCVEAQQVCCMPALQDGNGRYIQTSSPSRGLVFCPGSLGCLSAHADAEAVAGLPSFGLDFQGGVPFYGPTLRSLHSATGLH